jgi:hypothetical protein
MQTGEIQRQMVQAFAAPLQVIQQVTCQNQKELAHAFENKLEQHAGAVGPDRAGTRPPPQELKTVALLFTASCIDRATPIVSHEIAKALYMAAV